MAATASDSRAQFGETAATATEQMVGILYPGARIDWKNEAWLARAGQPPRELFFPGFLQRPEGSGFLFATGLKFPEQTRATAQAIRAGRRWPTGSAATRLAVFRSDLNGNIVEHTSGMLDAGGHPTQCLDIQVVRPLSDSKWPRLRVRYRGLYGGTGWSAVIEWTTMVDSTSMSVTERLPTRIMKQLEASGEVARTLTSRRISPHAIEITGLEGSTPLAYSCEERCIVSDQAVLSHAW